METVRWVQDTVQGGPAVALEWWQDVTLGYPSHRVWTWGYPTTGHEVGAGHRGPEHGEVHAGYRMRLSQQEQGAGMIQHVDCKVGMGYRHKDAGYRHKDAQLVP